MGTFHKKYTEHILLPPTARHQLFRVYNSLCDLQTSRKEVRQFWQHTRLPVLVLLAQKDQFVPNSAIRAYFKNNSGIALQTLPGNHQMVNAQTAQFILKNLS
ncbi:MAG: hypothetical protein R2795_09550 [Saprospiraceae bacterium]